MNPSDATLRAMNPSDATLRAMNPSDATLRAMNPSDKRPRIINPHYTNETRTIFINSEQRISGDDHDLIIKFGSVLPNQYEYFYCETIDFYGQSIRPTAINSSRFSPGLDAFDFIVNNYNSTESCKGQTIVPSVTFHASQQYTRRSYRLPYIVKNFNSKTIRFAVRSIFNDYSGYSFGSMRNWTLILSITPIKNEIPYYISTKKFESFTYSFSSNERISGHPGNCIIPLPPIYDQYEEYFVDVKIMQHTQSLVVIDEYALLFCEGWSETEYISHGQIIGGLVDSTGGAVNRFDSNPGSDNAVFRIKNMKQTRNIKFKLIYNDLTQIPDIFINGYIWHVSCLITPIK